MAFTYELATDLGKVRLLISDTRADLVVFQDDEITAYLEMEGSVLLAAARALEVMAANEAMVQKRITILDLKTDGPATSKELRELAATWRKNAADTDSDDEDDFAIAEQVVDEFTYRDRLLNDYLRNV